MSGKDVGGVALRDSTKSWVRCGSVGAKARGSPPSTGGEGTVGATGTSSGEEADGIMQHSPSKALREQAHYGHTLGGCQRSGKTRIMKTQDRLPLAQKDP